MRTLITVRSFFGTTVVVALAMCQTVTAQIVGGAGPSVMSRGGNGPGSRGSDGVDFTYYGGVTGTYQSGLLAPIIDVQGQAETADIYGAGVQVGIYGSHQSRRNSFGLDYRGNYQHYVNHQYFNGSDHALDFEYRHTLSRRWEIMARESGGTSTKPFGGFIAPAYLTTDYVSAPLTEVYNNRMYYIQLTGYAAYRQSARTMYTFGGGGFRTYRQSHALVNSNAGYAVASVDHRVSRNISLGASYNYMRFTYPRAFGQSDMHGATVDVERSVGRRSELRFSVGAYRIETLGNQQFELSPEIAAILGRATGVRVFYETNYLSQFAATITHRRQHVSYNAGFTRGASPGNGIYLTSQADTASAGVSYSGIRRLSFGLNAARMNMKSIGPSIPPYSSWGGGGGFGWAIGHGLNFVTQVDWRRLTAGSTIHNREGVSVSSGLALSSSSLPISLW